MASQYQPKQFFRRVPNELLARYFESKGVHLDLNFAELNETEIDPIVQAFMSLGEDEQGQIEIDFQNVHALANDAGIDSLLNEARFHKDVSFPEQISAIDGHYARVMWAFLEKKGYWKGATSLMHADNVSNRFWKKRNDLPHTPPHVDKEDTELLAKVIGEYFHNTEARGRHCTVEVFRKVGTQKEYFFAYPEDYGQSAIEWDRKQDKLTTRPQYPAFEIIFVYSQQEGSLDIYAPQNTKAVPELQKIFAKTILKLNTLADGSIDRRVYNLDPLASPHFDFHPPADSGVSDVVVTRLRLTLKHGSKRRITLEADTKRNRTAVYDLLNDLDPPPYFVTQVEIKAVFEGTPGKRASSKKFTITHPNLCNLNHDGKDAVLRKMLEMSGIEPHLPKDETDA